MSSRKSALGMDQGKRSSRRSIQVYCELCSCEQTPSVVGSCTWPAEPLVDDGDAEPEAVRFGKRRTRMLRCPSGAADSPRRSEVRLSTKKRVNERKGERVGETEGHERGALAYVYPSHQCSELHDLLH
jgi:hypothetical protein